MAEHQDHADKHTSDNMSTTGPGEIAPPARRITSTRDKAKMTYLPPDLDVEALIAITPNFNAIPRLNALQLEGDDQFKNLEEFIDKHVVQGGMPLVIENWHKRSDWPWHLFDPRWLTSNHGTDHVNVRDLSGAKDIEMSLGHYLKNLRKLSSKFTENDYEGSQQRLYAKDIDCPPVWRDKLNEMLPSSTFYLEEQGDLMFSLPPPARAENMMCYFGHEGTYTPAHKEMCASLGQNIMVNASSGDTEPGSSIWFMTTTADRDIIAEYWLSRMGHDIEVEAHFASIEDLQDAPFNIYIHEQKVGDYILVPPLAPHQVWNRGETTMKAAWNRTTVHTLELALKESLPKARLVCRDEQYKNRAIVHETLKRYTDILTGEKLAPKMDLKRVKKDFIRLFMLFDTMLLDEHFSPKIEEPPVEKIENEFNVTCSFCRGNIWNRFLTCKTCVETHEDDDDDDCYDICMDCYARGRSCFCISKLDWVEQHDWDDLLEEHEDFRNIVIEIQGTVSDESPVELSDGLKKLGRKTLAWVCQEQLKVRPWADCTKNGLEEEEADAEDIITKKKKDGKSLNCHVCKIRHDTWKCAECSTCNKVYCYGNLWRAFDMDPFDDVLCKFLWKCPVCIGVCSCGACRKKGDAVPYEPKGTFLGAPTKHVADPRSTESLVDFARGNLGWIRGRTFGKRKRASEFVMDIDSYGDDQIPIDPALGFDDIPSVNQGHAAQNGGGSTTHLEGRFIPTTNENAEDSGSNAFGSLQAHLQNAQIDRTREARGGGEGVGERNVEEQNDGGYGAHLADPNGRVGVHGGNSIIFNQTHHDASFGSNDWDTQVRDQQALTALEENPLAFIAAAGLHQLPAATPAQWTSLSPQPAQHPPNLYTDPHLLERHPSPPPPPPSTTNPTPPPPPPRCPLPRRPRVKTKVDLATAAAAAAALPPDRESQIGDWVRKTKMADRWVRHFKRKKSLLLTLRLPPEPFRLLDDDLRKRDKVTSDFVAVVPGRLVIPVIPVEGTPARRRRSEPVESGSEDSEYPGVEILGSTRRRREAYLRRKREEEDAKKVFMEKRARDMEERRKSMAENPNYKYQKINGNQTEVMGILKYWNARTPTPPPETEEERAVREAREEEERVVRVREEEETRIRWEKEEEEARILREQEEEAARIRRALEIEESRLRREKAAALRAAAAADRARLRAKEKTQRKVERARLRILDKELKRKETDRRAKLVAAGVLNSSDVEDYTSSSTGDDVSSDDYDDSDDPYDPEMEKKMLLIPHEWDFAVVVEPPSYYGWRDPYPAFPPSDPEVASSTAMSSLSSLGDTPPLPDPSLAVETPMPVKRKRGRPRKNSADLSKNKRRGRNIVFDHSDADKNFKTHNPVINDSNFAIMGRERRKSTLASKPKYAYLGEEYEEYENMDGSPTATAEDNSSVRAKKRVVKRVQVKPGKWAEAEITESEDEDKEEVEEVKHVPAVEVVDLVDSGDEGDMEVGVAEVGNEYEKRWSRGKKRF